MPLDITDILETWVQNLTFPVTIYAVSGAGTPANPYVLGVNSIYHAQIGYSITINSIIYVITAIDNTAGNNKLSVTGSPMPAVGAQFNLSTPYFFHGTAEATDAEVIIPNQNEFTKYPMIWLKEPYNEDFDEDKGSAIERVSNIELFFLTADYGVLQTDDIYTRLIQPMQSLKASFMQYIKDPDTQPAGYFWDKTGKNKYYAKLGVYINQKGNPKQLFADRLSGCELDLKMEIYKQNPSFVLQ